MWRVVFLLLLVCGGLAISCSKSPNDAEGNARVEEEGEKIFIVDRTGKKWDVTHAVKQYGFVADQFQFGLGPFAIRPILDPKMRCPGEDGYPDDRDSFLIMGTEINGEARAYPISVMSWHEVADERFGDTYVAVAY